MEINCSTSLLFTFFLVNKYCENNFLHRLRQHMTLFCSIHREIITASFGFYDFSTFCVFRPTKNLIYIFPSRICCLTLILPSFVSINIIFTFTCNNFTVCCGLGWIFYRKERLRGRMFLFLDLEVFVSRIFVAVDLHVGDVPFFGCDWNCDGLEVNISDQC